MGGDGGVVATNRRYMRGAGTADTTGDNQRHEAQKFNAQEVMTTCTLTKAPLFPPGKSASSTDCAIAIVADPYGSLYRKEAAVHALLKRKQQQPQSFTNDHAMLGAHVRRLGDLYDVRFHREDKTCCCPITGKALTGSIPAILLVPGKEGTPNVLSESALKQLSAEDLQEEYGPIHNRVRLAPPPTLLESIKEQVQAEHEKDEEARQAKKAKKKKRKRGDGEDDNEYSKKTNKSSHEKSSSGKLYKASSTTVPASTLGTAVQSRVNSAIQQNAVLSSLFTNKDTSNAISEKEKKDNLFAR
jgi:predicted house-cleaning noncanonical NTP pyrophosphatase (MazG superfamily)